MSMPAVSLSGIPEAVPTVVVPAMNPSCSVVVPSCVVDISVVVSAKHRGSVDCLQCSLWVSPFLSSNPVTTRSACPKAAP